MQDKLQQTIISERMAASKNATASVTLMTEIDATQLVEIRERLTLSFSEVWGFAPGYSDLLAVIVAKALRNHTYMNARINENYIQILKRINIGMAVDTERGLLVPVVKDADKISLRQFCEAFRGLVSKAREGRLLPDDLTGGTFTITNLGMYAIDGFTPIINLPECAILGVGRIIEKPVARDGNIVLRKMLTLSLVFDHRLVDGAPAARFLQYITRLVEEPYLVFAEY